MKGKTMWNRAKEIHKFLRKWYAYWKEEVDAQGNPPSGRTASDVASTVLDKIWKEKSERKGNEDDDDEEEVEVCVEECPTSSSSVSTGGRRTTTTTTAAATYGEMDDDEELLQMEMDEECQTEGQPSTGTDEEDVTECGRPKGFCPLFWWVFLLYGPYGAATFGSGVHDLLAIQGDGDDINKSHGRAHLRNLTQNENDNDRQHGQGNYRGMSDATHYSLSQNEEGLRIQRIELAIFAVNNNIKALQNEFDQAKIFHEIACRAGNESEKAEYLNEMKFLGKSVSDSRKEMNKLRASLIRSDSSGSDDIMTIYSKKETGQRQPTTGCSAVYSGLENATTPSTRSSSSVTSRLLTSSSSSSSAAPTLAPSYDENTQYPNVFSFHVESEADEQKEEEEEEEEPPVEIVEINKSRRKRHRTSPEKPTISTTTPKRRKKQFE